MQIKKRELVLYIVLTLVTCGLFGMYWMVVLTDDLNAITPDDDYQTSGILALIFSIITCGIYGVYWAYKIGRKFDRETGDNIGVLFLILNLIGASIVTYALAQYELNKRAEYVVPVTETDEVQ